MRDLSVRNLMAVSALILGSAANSYAATPVEIVHTDLKPMIRAAADSPSKFAVLIPHAASTATAGHWSTMHGELHVLGDLLWDSGTVGGTATQVTSQPVTLTVQPSPPPTVTLSVTPSTVTTGQNFTISYSSTDALMCGESPTIDGFTGNWGQTNGAYVYPASTSTIGNSNVPGAIHAPDCVQ
jgi:hypothetical protein